MKIVVGSASDRKIKVVKKGLKAFFPEEELEVKGFNAKSEVPDTPYDKDTFLGATNRAKGAREANPEADMWIGLESGLVERYGHLYEEAWVCLINNNRKEYYGYSSGLKVPDFVLRKMDELKMEHCDAMTVIEEEYGHLPNDTWGTYSGGLIAREVSLDEALRNALVQALAPENSFYNK